MSTDTWDPLTVLDRRVLGVLIEKQKTSKSPDAYPMTLNSLTLGCNQKSNRDPVLNLDEDEVEETLGLLQRRGLVSKITGGRVERWRHLLYEAWVIGKIEMAILAELFMRGPQTEGDLRGRASRMNEIADLDELRRLLKPLVERNLIIYLTAAERRGSQLTHGFHPPAELAAAKASAGSATYADDTPTVTRVSAPSPDVLASIESRLADALAQIAELRTTVASLEKRIAAFE